MTIQRFLRADRVAIAVGAGGACLLLGALGFQYIGGIAPCEMCHWPFVIREVIVCVESE